MKVGVKCYRDTCGKSFKVDSPPRQCPECGFRDLGIEEDEGVHELSKLLASRRDFRQTDSEKNLAQFFVQHPEVLREWEAAREKLLDPTAVKPPEGGDKRQALRAFLSLPNTWASAHTQDELLGHYPALKRLARAYLDHWFPKPKLKKAKKQAEPKPLELDISCVCGWSQRKARIAPQYCPACSRRSAMSIEQGDKWRRLLATFVANRGWSRHDSRLVDFLFKNPEQVEAWRDTKRKLTNPKLLKPDLSKGPARARQNFVRLLVPHWVDSHDMRSASFFGQRPLLQKLVGQYISYWTERFQREAA